MVENSPDSCVAYLVAAASDFLVGLRGHEGVDEDTFRLLASALRNCAAAWEGRDQIPRLGVDVLVDVFPATEASAYLYEGEERRRIMDMAFELQDLVRECVGVSA